MSYTTDHPATLRAERHAHRLNAHPAPQMDPTVARLWADGYIERQIANITGHSIIDVRRMTRQLPQPHRRTFGEAR